MMFKNLNCLDGTSADRGGSGLALTDECVTSGRILKEVLALAAHHREILQRRFSSYDYYLYEYPKCRIRFEVWKRGAAHVRGLARRIEDDRADLLIASFSSSDIQIRVPPICPEFTEEISYADPKFTDNTLSDILERLER